MASSCFVSSLVSRWFKPDDKAPPVKNFAWLPVGLISTKSKYSSVSLKNEINRKPAYPVAT